MIPGLPDGAQGRAPAISAHRGGSENGPGGTYEAYLKAVTTGAEYVEFDVRRTLDGTLVAWHDGRAGWGRPVAVMSYSRLCELAGQEVPRIAELMRLLAGRVAAHIDLKDAGCAAAVVRLGLDMLGPAGMIVTTGDRAVLAWVKRTFPAVPVGLTIGGGLARAVRLSVPLLREPSWSRTELDGAVRADWAVIGQRLARADQRARYQRQGLKTMVWTVNADPDLVGWLATPGVDALVTDRPARAVSLREQQLSGATASERPAGRRFRS
jgi:glycerophosphoryl diester phosphodiesterase